FSSRRRYTVLVSDWSSDVCSSDLGCAPGLGSHMSWSAKLDGQLAQAIMSIHAVKAVELGEGVANASKPGSQVHDEIVYNQASREVGKGSCREREKTGVGAVACSAE